MRPLPPSLAHAALGHPAHRSQVSLAAVGRAQLVRDFRLLWRRRGDAMQPLLFALMVVAMFPLALGASSPLLARIAPGVLWVAVLLAGSDNKNAYFHHRNGSAAVLRIDGNKVTKVGEVEVGGVPEGAAFTPDGKYLLIGNFLDQDISILKVDGSTITNTGKRFKLPGHPASVGMSTQ